MFNSCFLSETRFKAIRRRVLYRALDSLERGILYLASRIVDDVHSSVLASQLELIVKKLGNAMKNGFIRHVEEYGVKQATRMVEVAEKFSNNIAREWLSCSGFFSYLAFLDVNR